MLLVCGGSMMLPGVRRARRIRNRDCAEHVHALLSAKTFVP